jgi:hypothetical protein
LDEGADHAGAKSALLAGGDVEGHVLFRLLVYRWEEKLDAIASFAEWKKLKK